MEVKLQLIAKNGFKINYILHVFWVDQLKIVFTFLLK